MKTLDIEIAMMRNLSVRQNIIVPNVSWGIYEQGKSLHECDLLILSMNNYATEIEIKTSKQDLKKDKEKGHNHDSLLIKHLYFAVPHEMGAYAIDHIPNGAGLYTVEDYYDFQYKISSYRVIMIRKATARLNAIQWSESGRAKLGHLGSMRILGLKEKLLDMEKK